MTTHYVTGTQVNKIKDINQFYELVQKIIDDYLTLGNESDPTVLELIMSILDNFGVTF